MAKKPDQYLILDAESNAVEYGPSPGKDAAQAHLDSVVAKDIQGELAASVGRKLVLYKLTEV